MGDYHSYRSTRSYDDDDFVTSKNMTLHRLAADTLDDNDEIARRSRRHDQKLLSEITNKLDIYDAPLPHPRSHTSTSKRSSSVPRSTRTTTNHRRTPRHYPTTPTPTVGKSRRVEALVDYDLPNAMKSLSSVRDQMNEVRGGMGAHRMLIDRYLTLDLGPSQEVDYEVAKKYYELAARMPELEPDKYHRKALYSDGPAVNLGSRSRSVGNISHYGQFNQPVSELRNKLRKVITKSKRDPTFYSY